MVFHSPLTNFAFFFVNTWSAVISKARVVPKSPATIRQHVTHMKAIILAESDNSALRPLNGRKPGALIKINGIPLLEHQIRRYLNAGVAEASLTVVSGYYHNVVKRFLTRVHPTIRVVKNANYRSKNAARSLHLAIKTAEFDDESLLVSSVECVFDDHLIEALVRSSTNSVAGDTRRSGGTMLVKNGCVVSDGAAITKGGTTAVSAGVLRFNARATAALKRVVASRAIDTEVSMAIVVNDLVKTMRVTLVDVTGFNWTCVRSMDDLYDADKRFSRFKLSDTHCFILDLDGTVYIGDRPIRGAVKFIDRSAYKKEFYFVSNNTSKLAEDYHLKLSAMNVTTIIDHVITPLAPLISYMQSHALQRIYLLGNARIETFVRQALPGLQLTADPDKCEALVVAYDTELTYEKLQNAAVLLQQNPRLPFLATHGDLVCPTEDGFIPDCGCILSVLEQTTGRRPHVIFGKPSPRLVKSVVDRFGSDRTAIVGDRLYTDGKMARNVGCSFICVLSGETTRKQIDDLDEDDFPTLIVKDLGELLL